MKKLGYPRTNQRRSLTKKEKAILSTRRSNLIVCGTENGFDIFDGGTGQYIDLTSKDKTKLMYFWEMPIKYVWGDSNAET